MIGYFSRLSYDEGAYPAREHVGILEHSIDPTRIYNCASGFADYLPIDGYGVSMPVHKTPDVSHGLVDVESILTGRMAHHTKLPDHDVSKDMYDDLSTGKDWYHPPALSDRLAPIHTRLMDPPSQDRCKCIDRFYDLPMNPQANIFWDHGKDSRLEAKDNYVMKAPKMWDPEAALPRASPEPSNPCRYGYSCK
jgi:hypothetical protein